MHDYAIVPIKVVGQCTFYIIISGLGPPMECSGRKSQMAAINKYDGTHLPNILIAESINLFWRPAHIFMLEEVPGYEKQRTC